MARSQDACMSSMTVFADVSSLASDLNRDSSDIDNYIDGLVKCGRLVRYRSVPYAYVDSSLGWCPLSSINVHKMISVDMGLLSPVNYSTAAAPVIEKMRMTTAPEVIVPTSICISRLRMMIEEGKDNEPLRGPIAYLSNRLLHSSMVVTLSSSSLMNGYNINGIKLKPCVGLTSVAPERSTSGSGFCVSPLPFSMTPTLISPDITSSSSKWITNGAGVEAAYTIKWIVGNALMDPQNNNARGVILCGRGGSGKSSIVRIIKAMFKYACGDVDVRLFSEEKRYEPNSVIGLSDYRILVGGDTEFKNGSGLNTFNSKLITGGDIISKSYVISTNIPPSCKYLRSWVKPENVRRHLLIEIDGCEVKRDEDHLSDEADLLALASECVYIRYRDSGFALISPRVMMDTLFLNHSKDMQRDVKFSDGTDLLGSFLATLYISGRVPMDYIKVVDAVKSMCPGVIKNYVGVPVVSNIVLKAGVEIVCAPLGEGETDYFTGRREDMGGAIGDTKPPTKKVKAGEGSRVEMVF